MRLLLVLLFALFCSPAVAQLNFTTYAAGGRTPCLGCGAVLSTGTVSNINFNWGGGQVLNSGRSDGVSVKFTGFLTVPGTGSQTITFYNSSDDGFILKLNDVTVLSDWQEQGAALYNGSGAATLVGGQTYSLEVWYYENGGGAAAQLYWNQSGSIQLISNTQYAATNPKAFGDGGQSLPATSVTQLQQTKIQQTSSISTSGIYIESRGNYNTVSIEQFSRDNMVRGVDGAQRALINGSYNTIVVHQGTVTTPIGDNLLEMSVVGNSNQVNVTQQHNVKYAEVKINGSSNDLDIQQKDAGGKSAFINVQGGFNSIDLLQQGSSQHFADINILTSNNIISMSQSGSAQKLFSLTINSPNVGVTILQTNPTVGDSASMAITCTTGPCNGYSYTKN